MGISKVSNTAVKEFGVRSLNDLTVLSIDFDKESNLLSARIQYKDRIHVLSYDSGDWSCSCHRFLFTKKCRDIEKVKLELRNKHGVIL